VSFFNPQKYTIYRNGSSSPFIVIHRKKMYFAEESEYANPSCPNCRKIEIIQNYEQDNKRTFHYQLTICG